MDSLYTALLFQFSSILLPELFGPAVSSCSALVASFGLSFFFGGAGFLLGSFIVFSFCSLYPAFVEEPFLSPLSALRDSYIFLIWNSFYYSFYTTNNNNKSYL